MVGTMNDDNATPAGDNGTHYPDSPPATLGDLKSIKRHPQMKIVAPTIKWGKDYKKWPIEKRLRYAERLASTMNHAADVLQTERNEQNVTIATLEKQLAQQETAGTTTHEMMRGQLGRDNEEKQKLGLQIVELTKANKKLRRTACESPCGCCDACARK